jgi:hypothetical protein
MECSERPRSEEVSLGVRAWRNFSSAIVSRSGQSQWKPLGDIWLKPTKLNSDVSVLLETESPFQRIKRIPCIFYVTVFSTKVCYDFTKDYMHAMRRRPAHLGDGIAGPPCWRNKQSLSLCINIRPRFSNMTLSYSTYIQITSLSISVRAVLDQP